MKSFLAKRLEKFHKMWKSLNLKKDIALMFKLFKVIYSCYQTLKCCFVSLLIAAHITDWVSIALAVTNGVDPSEMASIEGLKAHLATIQ